MDVFVDTNVLFPFSVMDLMLALTEDGIHEMRWTEALLDEWERVIVREQRRSTESAARITATIREFFPEGRVAEKEYANLIADMPGRDPDDRQHMAAAVAAGVGAIITWNRAHFPEVALARWGIRVMDPDEYLCQLVADLPQEIAQAAVRLAAEKRRPPLTPHDLADRLAKAGTPNFAARLIDLLGARVPSADGGIPAP
jgi:predicted nucleic acid-binding protein